MKNRIGLIAIACFAVLFVVGLGIYRLHQVRVEAAGFLMLVVVHHEECGRCGCFLFLVTEPASRLTKGSAD